MATNDEHPMDVKHSPYEVSVHTVLSDGKDFELYAERSEDEWLISFSVDNETGITGEGNSYEVFRALRKALRCFMDAADPQVITFNAESKSRNKLYQRVIKRMFSGKEVSSVQTGEDTVAYKIEL